MNQPNAAPGTQARAACSAAWANPDWWFSGQAAERALAQALCDGCPLAQQCLALALAGEGTVAPRYRFGLYAGTTPTQRWRIATGTSDGPTWPADPLVDPAAAAIVPNECVRNAG